MDTPALGRQIGRTRNRRARLVRNRAGHAKKNKLKPWRKRQWCIPPQQNAAFVCQMEDVLETYRLPYDPQIHSLASLYEAFEPAEARRIGSRLEIHHTPKHGSWLNVAEIELSVLGRQCLDRRIADAATLTHEVAAWEATRNTAQFRVDWQFTTDDARIRLKRLYPVLQP